MAPAANASPETAFAHCRDGATPSATYHTSILNSDTSTAVGLPTNFWAGDYYRVHATGVIHTSGLVWDNYTPDGRTDDTASSTDRAWPGPGRIKFSLVASF